MKVVLIAKGEDTSLTPSEWQSRKDYWTGIGTFAIAFGGDVRQTLTTSAEDLAEYDLIIGNLDRDCIDKLLQLQENRPVHTKWVSLIERCATDYLPSDERVKRLLDNSDLVNVINKRTVGYFRALTTARCEYIGIPFPAESIRSKFKTITREFRIMLPPYVDPPRTTMNASYLAAKGFPLYGANPDCYTYNDPLYYTFGYKNPIEYLHFVGESFAFMNLDHRYTWGRSVLECAVLGVPCIATESTGHAEDFFPLLTVKDEFSTEQARKLLLKLVNDADFYKEVSEPSLDLMQEYTHERIAQKIVDCI